jgi:hypothetical protein
MDFRTQELLIARLPWTVVNRIDEYVGGQRRVEGRAWARRVDLRSELSAEFYRVESNLFYKHFELASGNTFRFDGNGLNVYRMVKECRFFPPAAGPVKADVVPHKWHYSYRECFMKKSFRPLAIIRSEPMVDLAAVVTDDDHNGDAV